MVWEKTPVNHIYDKGLFIQSIEELSILNNIKTIFQWAKYLPRDFTKENIDQNRAHEKMFTTAKLLGERKLKSQ